MRLEFDPKEAGKAEIGWWIAHNQKNKKTLFELLVEQHTVLYGLSHEAANQALLPLIDAVEAHDSRNWEGAIESATKYYQSLKDKTGLVFDPEEVATLEIGWWRLHDELEGNPDKAPLVVQFTKLYSQLFGIPEEKLKNAAISRALATLEHDLAEDPETSPSKASFHWEQAEKFLVGFYEELKKSSEPK